MAGHVKREHRSALKKAAKKLGISVKEAERDFLAGMRVVRSALNRRLLKRAHAIHARAEMDPKFRRARLRRIRRAGHKITR